MRTIECFGDRNQAWAKVPAGDLVDLGVAEEISGASRMALDEESVFLDLDTDFPTYKSAADREGWAVDFDTKSLKALEEQSSGMPSPVREFDAYDERELRAALGRDRGLTH